MAASVINTGSKALAGYLLPGGLVRVVVWHDGKGGGDLLLVLVLRGYGLSLVNSVVVVGS